MLTTSRCKLRTVLCTVNAGIKATPLGGVQVSLLCLSRMISAKNKDLKKKTKNNHPLFSLLSET